MTRHPPAKGIILLAAGVLVVVAGAAGAVLYADWDRAVPLAGMAINYFETLDAPAGTLTTEVAGVARYAGPDRAGSEQPGSAIPAAGAPAASDDWPSYNRTLTSERYAPLAQINAANVGQLKVLCTYDTRQYTGFESGLIEVDGALIGTTAHDIFAIDPADCHEKWRTHEKYAAVSLLAVNRGAAYLDGMLYRGTEDGRVLAYDFKTGVRVWSTTVTDGRAGESTPAAPIAWNGLVFIGNAGGDNKGVKGRMYALDARSGRIVWEFYLVPRAPGDPTRAPQGVTPLDLATWGNGPGTPVSGGASWTSYTLDPATGLLYVPSGNPAPDFATGPRDGENLYSGSIVVLDARTGAYRTHWQLAPRDWHDWDVSTAPALIRTRGGRRMLAVAPKDGHLYGVDLDGGTLRYRTPVTRIENADVAFMVGKAVHFCPGSVGGAEWNGASYDPQTNLVLVGEVDWCSTVTLAGPAGIARVKTGQPWSAMATSNPYDTYGKPDAHGRWAGWLYATDADSGAWRWRVKSNYPILGGVTPTAGGVVFFGDMGGNFYAVDASDGTRLWGARIGGAIGGGVITYATGGAQRVAVATGFTSILWPTEVTTAKIVILGLANSAGLSVPVAGNPTLNPARVVTAMLPPSPQARASINQASNLRRPTPPRTDP